MTSINLDLIYGLPKQTLTGAMQTARRILELQAERISVFGYAHVPWMKRHQQLIATSSLPDEYLRFAQMQAIGDILVRDGGYTRVGLDHYAKPGDALVRSNNIGSLRRNFQGYSTDAATALIGLGASAIGSLQQGYIQNTANPGAYKAAIRGGRLAAARGLCLTADDRRRRAIIERIMCDLRVELCDIDAALVNGKDFVPFIADGLMRWDGRLLIVTETGRPFLRNIAALFDSYLPQKTETPQHAAAI